jgi:uncharacterized protein YecE (DUF72 family)
VSFDRAALARLRDRLPAGIHFGTSSWTYPGWKGLVYEQDYPATGAGDRMLAEYARFPLFTTVGIDSTFYAPPTPKTLAGYAAVLPEGFRCVSKVWDRITVHTFAKARAQSKGGQQNPDFLNAELFQEAVLAPYLDHFAAHMGPFVFEFQQVPSGKRGMDPQQFAEGLDRFFGALPRGPQYSVELRNAEFLVPAYFAVMREHNVAHLFNSWTRMPPIGAQLELPESITADFVVARALLRPGRQYATAVEAFAPYDRVQDENPELRDDLARLAETAVTLRVPAYILVNNRAEGSAPHTIAAVARMVAGGNA